MKGKAQNKNCPICSLSLDIDTYVPGHGNDEHVEVDPGDITFCFNCSAILIINEALNPVVPEADKLIEIMLDPDFHNFVNEIAQARRNKINPN